MREKAAVSIVAASGLVLGSIVGLIAGAGGQAQSRGYDCPSERAAAIRMAHDYPELGDMDWPTKAQEAAV